MEKITVKKTPIENLVKSLESRKKNLTGQLQRITETYEAESQKLKDKIEIVEIQINAFKNKK